MCAHSDVIALVVDQTLVSVSSCQGLVLAGSAQPAHRFTTWWPPATTATLAPISSRCAKFSTNASRTGSNPGAQRPWISVLASLMRANLSPSGAAWRDASFRSATPSEVLCQRPVWQGTGYTHSIPYTTV